MIETRMDARRARAGHTARWIAVAGMATFAVAPGKAQHGDHPVHPVMSDQRLIVRLQPIDGSGSVEAPVEIGSFSGPSDLDQTIALPGSDDRVVLRRFLPHASLEQSAAPVDDGSGKAAVELSIEGPTQSIRRWMIADDPERNRLSSFIGTWRFMAAADSAEADSLFRQFETEFTRDPALVVSRADGTGARTLELKPGTEQRLDDLACTIRVLRFFADYAVDAEKNEAVNRSDRRLNPAVEVEVAWASRSERRWIFGKFPSFSAKDRDQLPVRIELDCPAEGTGDAPDYAMLAVAKDRLEIWARHRGKCSRSPMAVREPREVVGSQYKFQVLEFAPSARLEELYQPATPGKGGAAMQVEFSDADSKPARVWLALGESKAIRLKRGLVTVQFISHGDQTPTGAHP